MKHSIDEADNPTCKFEVITIFDMLEKIGDRGALL